jgi:hypothetical protein
MKHVFKVGDKVKLTAKFLRSTGQYMGGEGSRRWTVKGLSGSFVVTDEELSSGYYSSEELAADPTLKYRRIHPNNLMLASAPDRD